MASKRRLLTNEQDAWLREHAAGHFIRELTEMLNVEFATSFNTEQIRAYMSRYHIQNGMWRNTSYKHKKLFTEEENEYLLSINNMKHAQEVADLFNAKYPGKDITADQIKGWRARNKLNCGLTGQFQKGQIPFNKGMKWNEFMPMKAQQACKHGQFKKGNRPHNWHPVGTERISSQDGYVWIKVKEPKTWKQRSHIVWEKAHGPVPEGYEIMHKDQNPLNDDLGNLELVSRNELRVMNQKYKLTSDPDLNEAIHMVAKLDIKIRELEKKGSE